MLGHYVLLPSANPCPLLLSVTHLGRPHRAVCVAISPPAGMWTLFSGPSSPLGVSQEFGAVVKGAASEGAHAEGSVSSESFLIIKREPAATGLSEPLGAHSPGRPEKGLSIAGGGPVPWKVPGDSYASSEWFLLFFLTSPGPPPGRLQLCSLLHPTDVVVAVCCHRICEHQSFVQQVLMERQAPTDARRRDVVVKGRDRVGRAPWCRHSVVLIQHRPGL